MSTKYYISSSDSKVTGPFSSAVIRTMIEANDIDGNTLICAEGSDAWLPASSMQKYFISSGDAKETGPYSPAVIRTMIEANDIDGNTLIRMDGSDVWITASSLLKGETAPMPTVPGAAKLVDVASSVAPVSESNSGYIPSINSYNDAQKAIKHIALGILIPAIVFAVLVPSYSFYSILIAVLSLIMWVLKSRIAAIILMLICLLPLIATILSWLGMLDLGKFHIYPLFTFFLAIMGVKAVEATFKINGEYRRP